MSKSSWFFLAPLTLSYSCATLISSFNLILSYWNKSLYMQLSYRQVSATMSFLRTQSCANGLSLCCMCNLYFKAMTKVTTNLLYIRTLKYIKICVSSRYCEYSLVYWKFPGQIGFSSSEKKMVLWRSPKNKS